MSDIQIKKSRKSRRRKHDSDKQHHQRLAEWKTSLLHDVNIKSQSNSMTQIYYTTCLLLVYANEINECRVSHDQACIFQEDNDSNHDTRSAKNIVRSCKADYWLNVLIHFSKSPDLNSSKEVWYILKMRVRRRRCDNVKELKRVILKKWDKITLNEIRARISEMSDRCKNVIIDERTVKSDLW
jgi:hypothetical protein